MKKKDLMLFIDAVERKAVRSVEEKFGKLIAIEKTNILRDAGYTERTNKLQKKVNELHAEAQSLILDVEEDITVKYSYYSNIAYDLRNQIGKSTIKDSIINNSKFSGGSVELIRNAKAKEIEEVKIEYSKVKAICDSFHSAEKISEYLKGLDFDLSTLEKQENKALMCKIDKSKLFVCGENK